MATKKVEKVLNPPPHHWVGDGFKVHTFFPSGEIDKPRMSPFFLLDYNTKINLQPSDKQRGVDSHPHRGFETVTISYHGSVAHHDSAGNSGVIHEGDVQWMTAGSGVLHKEYHEEEFSKKGGSFQMVQLWVNLPSKFKMTDPKYQSLKHENMGKFELADGKGIVNVIAGEFKSVKGPASTFTPVNIYDIKLNSGADLSFDLPNAYNTGILVIEGSITINDKETASADQFVLFSNIGDTISISTTDAATILVLSGEPINETIFN